MENCTETLLYWEFAESRKHPKTVELERRAWESRRGYAHSRSNPSDAKV